MSDLSKIFKAYDIRGKVSSELTPAVTQRIGKALADFLPTEGAVAVGYDMRPDSQALADGVIKGLTEQGRDVVNIGQITSDMIYFAVGKYGYAGGAMITASHNPGDDNGIKLCGELARPIGEETGLITIRDNVLSDNYAPSPTQGSVSEKDVIDGWVEHVLSFIKPDEMRELSIAVDAGNGMAGKIFPEIEPFLPLDVHEMYFELDGTFPNHIANPIVPENIVDLQKVIVSEKRDAGIAFDGDGDRAVLIDENGESVSGSVMTALLADYFLDLFPEETIIYNAVCGRIVPEVVEAKGGKAVRERVGHSFIKASMGKNNALFAGEGSGHYFFKENWNADSGMIAAMIGIYLLARQKKPLSELVKPYRESYKAIPETNFTVDDKAGMIEKIAAEFSDGQQDRLDGLTVNYPNSWFNVRPSNTEPLLRLTSEAKTQGELDSLVSKVKDIIVS